MGDKTDIEWTDATNNYLRGCSREMAEGAETSGCGDPTGGGCYAERNGWRFAGPGMPYEGLVRMTPTGARWTGKVLVVDKHLLDALRWKEPKRIFTTSVSDPFHERFTNETVALSFGLFAATSRHTHQLLSKRMKRGLEWFAWVEREAASANAGVGMTPAAFCFALLQRYVEVNKSGAFTEHDRRMLAKVAATAVVQPWPLPNVWMGASVEHQAAAEDRIPKLLRIPAAVRWLSIEPMIGEVDLLSWLGGVDVHELTIEHDSLVMRVGDVASEAFGPFPVQTAAEALSAIEHGCFEARKENAHVTSERDEARARCTTAQSELLPTIDGLTSINTQLGREFVEMTRARNKACEMLTKDVENYPPTWRIAGNEAGRLREIVALLTIGGDIKMTDKPDAMKTAATAYTSRSPESSAEDAFLAGARWGHMTAPLDVENENYRVVGVVREICYEALVAAGHTGLGRFSGATVLAGEVCKHFGEALATLAEAMKVIEAGRTLGELVDQGSLAAVHQAVAAFGAWERGERAPGCK